MKWYIIVFVIISLISGALFFVIDNQDFVLTEVQSILTGVKEKSEEAIPFNSTYSKYGYYKDLKIFVARDGLQYNPRDNGGMRVLNQGNEIVLAYGTCLSGNSGGSPIKVCEPDYEWTWKHSTEEVYFILIELNESDDEVNVTYVMQKDIFTGYNNDLNLNWTKTYEFTPRDDVKITDTLTNNFGDVTNTKFWYVMKDPGVIRYNGQEYNTSNVEVNQQGNFNNVISNVDFGAGSFLYQDMLDDNFDLVHIYLGDGTPIGYDDVRLIGLGFTKGSGNFNEGQIVILDPVSTGFKIPLTFGDPYTNWTATSNLQTSNDVYATETTANSFAFTGGYIFGIPDSADNITGFEIKVEGRTEGNPCAIKAKGFLRVGVSLDNGTTLSSESTNMVYNCVIPPLPDTIIIKGSSNDTFGLGEMNVSNISSSFRMFIKAQGFQSTDFNPGMDAVSVAVFYNVPLPIISPASGNIVSGSVINSTFLVNITTSNSVDLTSALFESNYSGVLTNYSLIEEGNSNHFSRYFEGNNNSIDGDEGAINGTIGLTGTFWGFSGTDNDNEELVNVNVSSELPSVILNFPLNGSDQSSSSSIIFNITNNDSDNDYIDLIIVSTYGLGYDERNYLQIFESIVNRSDAIHNLSIGTIDANDPDLFILYKMDGLERFGESFGAGQIELRDFSNNLNNGSNGPSGSPTRCSNGNIIAQNMDCLNFSGFSQTVEIFNGTETGLAEIFASKEFSIGTWLYSTDTTGATRVPLGRGTVGTVGADSYFYISGGLTLSRFQIFNSTSRHCLSTVTGLSANAWHHVTFVMNSTTQNITGYANGIENSVTDCSLIDNLNVTRWEEDSPTFETLIGGMGEGGNLNEWMGALDEMFIFNKTLAPQEVLEIFEVRRNPFTWSTRQWDSPEGQVQNNFTFTTTPTDSCTYTSDNWDVACADNCSITSNVDVLDNNISITGIGKFEVFANISNFDTFYKDNSCLLIKPNDFILS